MTQVILTRTCSPVKNGRISPGIAIFHTRETLHRTRFTLSAILRSNDRNIVQVNTFGGRSTSEMTSTISRTTRRPPGSISPPETRKIRTRSGSDDRQSRFRDEPVIRTCDHALSIKKHDDNSDICEYQFRVVADPRETCVSPTREARQTPRTSRLDRGRQSNRRSPRTTTRATEDRCPRPARCRKHPRSSTFVPVGRWRWRALRIATTRERRKASGP